MLSVSSRMWRGPLLFILKSVEKHLKNVVSSNYPALSRQGRRLSDKWRMKEKAVDKRERDGV